MQHKVFKKWLNRPLTVIRCFLKTLLDLIYPPVCHLCHQQLVENEEIICSNCWQNLPRIPLDTSLKSSQTGKSIFFQQTLSIWKFEESLPDVIHLFKYKGYTKLALELGRSMAFACHRNQEYQAADLLLPVPLHSARLRERGYNQSLLLCQRIGELTGFQVADNILVRIKNTPTQTRLNAQQRAQNVDQAFRVVSPDQVKGKIIILVDDVLTTGATLNACAFKLLKAGAKSVLVLTACHA